MIRIVITLINPIDFLQGDLKDKKSYKLRKQNINDNSYYYPCSLRGLLK